jgi:ligand-binding sensor domain-containing protein
VAGRRLAGAVLLAAWAIAGPALTARDNGPARDEPRFEPVRGSDELRDPRIWDIVRDRVGFMWFATFSGLVRYDGFEYRWFVSDPRDEFSLSDNRLSGLLADSDGAVWASTWDAGLNRFDPETGRFTRYRHDPQDADA